METTEELREDVPYVVSWSAGNGEQSSGPLSVLWSLIESYKVDIFEVSLARITEDFLTFLKLAKNLPIELSSEFAKMAASLVYFKSKALLPNPGFDEIDSEPTLPKELVDKLLEHKKYQIAANRLSEIDLVRSCVFRRESDQILIDFPGDENWLDLDLIDLISAFNQIITRGSANQESPSLLIADSKYSIGDKLKFIEDMLMFRKEIHFSEIFQSKEPDTYDIVYSFLALLEIVKLKRVRILQHRMFGDIKIQLVE
ncbi:MAG: segregation/condensation protein A [Leptospiraceae bacterium]|nr:segregation/condensation protein A [Leptospiraceae bacterium]